MEQTKWELAWAYLLGQMQQASTIRAVFILMGGSAAWIDPAKAEAYLALAGIAAGLVGIFFPDKLNQPKE